MLKITSLFLVSSSKFAVQRVQVGGLQWTWLDILKFAIQVSIKIFRDQSKLRVSQRKVGDNPSNLIVWDSCEHNYIISQSPAPPSTAQLRYKVSFNYFCLGYGGGWPTSVIFFRVPSICESQLSLFWRWSSRESGRER